MPNRFSLLCICLSPSLVLYSHPQQGAVATGTAEIVQNNDHMQITASDRAILNWDSFSIDKVETLQFVQPTNQAAVLNRVIGLTESRLDGKLLANGHVYLINPNGLIIGKDAVINTACFLGTTLQISNEDFLNNTNLLFQGDATASIVNLGTIECSDGPVTLIAHKIDNQGLITSNDTVSLIAGHEILLSSSHDILRIRPDIQAGGIESSGVIEALRTRIENDGLQNLGVKQIDQPNATKIVATGGKIFLRAEGSPAIVSGELKADGGSVHVLGEVVHIKNGASIDVSGIDGGGEILIGGDYQGANLDIPNARRTMVEPNVQLKADALENGNGGKIIVWSDEATFAYNKISARGGAKSGDGGLVEVSGKYLDFHALSDTSAPQGRFGTLLLDPQVITISASPDSGWTGVFNDVEAIKCAGVDLYNLDNTFISSPTNINTTTLTNQLATNCVTIDTSAVGATGLLGTITVSDPFMWSAPTTLSLIADASITVNAGINNMSTDIGFTAINLSNRATVTTSDYAGITISDTGSLVTMGGDIIITGIGYGTTSTKTAHGVNIALESTISSTIGNITITGTGGASTGATNNGINFTSISPTTFTFSGTGTVTLNGTGGGAGASSGNNGIFFGSSSGGNTASLVLLGGITVVMTGQGGTGTGGSHNGVYLYDATFFQTQSVYFDSNTTLTFTNCHGGTGGGTGGNARNFGVYFEMFGGSLTGAEDFITVSFENIHGGTSNVGTGGNNYGVYLVSLSLSGAHSLINFYNLFGGDSGSLTSSDNNGLVLPTVGGSILAAATVTGSNIFGGAALQRNYGLSLGGSQLLIGSDPAYSLPVNVNLTATGGASTNGSNNSGINSGGFTLSAPFGGTINLTGIGGGSATAISDNLGITGSFSDIDLENSAALYVTGTGGQGTGSTNSGVSFGAISSLTLLADSEIYFTGCKGGSGAGGNNGGVFFSATGVSVTDDASCQIVFEDCSGGTGGTTNFGVAVDNLTLSSAPLVFSNISGGSTGGAGVIIQGTVSAPEITASGNIVGGAASSNNYGFEVQGTLGDSTLPEIITITAIGGASTTGNNNIGIYVPSGGTVQTGAGGSIALNGTGDAQVASGGINHGIDFDVGSNLIAGGGFPAATISMIGVGGKGTGASSSSDGVLIQGAVTLNSSYLSFLSCKGGTSLAGRNIGVFLSPTAFTADVNAVVSFNSIVGGSSNGAGSGNNYGVEISGVGIPLTNSPATISFSNITGGDTGNANTTDNFGIFINTGATVSASTIIATSITGGSALDNNYGLEVLGTLGSAALPQNITVSAAGGASTTGSGNIGILVFGAIQTGPGGSITLIGTGNTQSPAGGGNHGIQFAGLSTLSAAVGAPSMLTLTGTGGSGTGSAQPSDGVFIQGAIDLNSSYLSFLNCKGGSNGSFGGNVGVLLDPAAFTGGTNASVFFNSITGGNSTLGGGSNYGVQITGTVGIPFTVSPSTITFSNISGGDTGNATSNNSAIHIDTSGTVSASAITATTNIVGGAADGDNNYGFELIGTLGSPTLTQNINITAAGGNSTTGGGNIGIYVGFGGLMQTGLGGSITLTGTGNMTVGSGGINHGIEFDLGSTLTATSGAISAIKMTGTGGSGTSETHGVLIQGIVNLNSSSLSFNGCTGGSSHAGGNAGVFFLPTAFTGSSNGAVFFNSIQGGISGAGGIGNNYGVEISGVGIPFTAPSTTIAFSNITGGDATFSTSDNIAIFIGTGATVSAATVIATANITGGDALSDNYGVAIFGTLGDATLPQNITVSATGGPSASLTGNNNGGIYVGSGGVVQTGHGGSITLTGIGNNIVATGGANHGIQFDNGSSLIAGAGAAAAITLTGIGGGGTGPGSACIGVLIEGAVNLNSSSLSFINCTGGNSNVGGNVGVSLVPTAFTAVANAAVYFNSIVGGVQGGGNYGVEINGLVGIPLTNSPATITFSNITGGDTGNATTNNAGIIIGPNATVSASTIIATANIVGGAALDNNPGFWIDGTLGNASFPQNITIAASGGASATGNNNVGIYVAGGGTVQNGIGGTITLTGTGNILAGSGGANHGIQFDTGSNLAAAPGGASTITMTGIGGRGTAGAASDGVQILANITLNGATLSFNNCSGGLSGAGGNDGVFFAPMSFTGAANGAVIFNSILGGLEGGSNSGVEISGMGIPFTSSPTTITFSNITGGDSGFATSNNVGVLIDSGATVSASTITATANITGSAALNNNNGFEVDGILGSAGSPQNITITATGGASTTGNNNIGIFVSGTVQTGPGGSIALTGTGNTLNPTGGGLNHGIEFAAGSALNATNGAASTITMSGMGGSGTGAGSASGGVLIEGAVTLNTSSLSFNNCFGGSSNAAGNDGVFFSPTAFTGTSGSVSFNSILGGTGGGGSNYGVEITGTMGIPFTTSPSAITFSNIIGGDSSNATSNNAAVFIDTGLMVSASTITATTNIEGGAALNDNYGFEVAGTLGSSAFAQNIAITASGGASATGTNNIGIFVSGLMQTGPGGSIVLTGNGNTQAASGGTNHGIQFAAGSTLTGTSGAASTITMTGTGGNGTAASGGVLIQGALNLNTSSLSFINTKGGVSSAGSNIGVALAPTAFTGTSGSVLFNSVLGGTSGAGGGGNNYGVEISGSMGLPFSNASSAITFNAVKGGDSGNGTASNHGVLISGGVVSAGNIVTGVTPILSGAGTDTNIGFYLTNGAILGSGVTQAISITALSLGIGANEVGIQTDMSSLITTGGGAGIVLLTGTAGLSSTAPLYGIVMTDAGSQINGASGVITLSSPHSSILLENGVTISSSTGNIQVIADVDIVETGGATISTTGGTITLVTDNTFPVSTGAGLGILNIPNLVLTTTGGAAVKLYGSVENSGNFPAFINGAAYTPMMYQAQPIYFPAGNYPAGDPYFIYYKTFIFVCPPCP